MRFGILGPLEVWEGGRAVELGPPKQRAVLAALLLAPNRVVALDGLVEILWGAAPPARALGALQVYVSGLRAALEPREAVGTRQRYLVTRSPGYVLNVDPGDIDAVRFERLCAEGRRLLADGMPGPARDVLAAGLELWRGPALAEFVFDAFAQGDAARLEERRLIAVEDRVDADLALGRHVALTAELEALVVDQPLRERLWGQFALALYRSERQSEALRVLARLRTLLNEEVGVQPGPAVQDLQRRILAHDPSLAWRAPAAAAEAPAPGGIIGRAGELAILRRALAAAGTGRGGVVLIWGEPGIGKTRLVEEVVAEAQATGAVAAWGRCHEGEGAPPFWPWVQVVRSLLQTVDRDTMARALRTGAGEIAQIASEVKELVPDLEPPPALEPEAARFRLFEAVNGVLSALAADLRRPLLVVLDDLHWADAGSLRLAELVASRAAESGVLLIGTFRDVDPRVGGALADTLGVLARVHGVERAGLGGLSEAECARCIAQSAGVEPSPGVAATVHARTDGNPFFVGELARLLASEHALRGAGSTRTDVPAGVRDVIRRRLARLPGPTVELLSQAAVIGRDIDVAVLSAAGRVDPAEVLELIDAAFAVGILVEDTAVPGRFRFSHALVQETIVGELGLVPKANLHARAAVGLRVTYGAEDSRAVALAHHLFAATPVVPAAEALDAALRAADVAERRLAHDQAVQQLRRALELAGRMPAGSDRLHRELEVQQRLAALLSLTEGYHSAAVTAAWSRARELCDELGDTPEVLSTLWGLSRAMRTRCQFAVALRLGDQLLALGRRSPTSLFAAAGHECAGLPRLFMGDAAEAAVHLAEAVALSDEAVADAVAGPASLVLYPAISCRSYLSCARWYLGDGAAADRLQAEALSLAASSGHPLSRAIAQLYAGKLATMRGDVDAVLDHTDEVDRVSAGAPLGALESVSALLRGWAEAQDGDARGGEARFQRALNQLRASEWRLAMTYFLALQADIQVAAGRPEQAFATCEAGLAEAAATGERYYEAELCRRLAALDPSPAESARWLRRAVETARAQGAVAFLRRAEASADGHPG